MTAAQNKLGYISQYRSGLEIELQTGISLFNQKGIAEGSLKPSSDQQQALRNMFQRTSYKNLRDAGMPYHQANRFSWQVPKVVEKQVKRTTEIINQLTEYATAGLAARYDKAGKAYDIMDLYSQMYDSMYEGIKSSKQPLEGWENYIAGIESRIRSH